MEIQIGLAEVETVPVAARTYAHTDANGNHWHEWLAYDKADKSWYLVEQFVQPMPPRGYQQPEGWKPAELRFKAQAITIDDVREWWGSHWGKGKRTMLLPPGAPHLSRIGGIRWEAGMAGGSM